MLEVIFGNSDAMILHADYCLVFIGSCCDNDRCTLIRKFYGVRDQVDNNIF
jgi:hypothetical protein